ncbi:MAG: hypothetical protein GAK30_01302 [Paracidovorax wautersii]|uniref:SIMPL domain-containing protein n=1 Tax=Paracidovorax wautersii TaxID=1177982 RepID=A0A7V8FQ86_9BURK|nr:MAG: hypothetical protein GAK30_01302 [Paracidovorax wautersii]
MKSSPSRLRPATGNALRATVGGAMLAACVVAAWPAAAQVVAGIPVPANVVQLSATGSVEVPQDFLTITLAATREAADAATVQSQLRAALDTALAQAKAAEAPGRLEVRTGGFSLSPRYDRNGKISTWQGRSELVIQGRDFARISTLAGQIQTLVIADVGFSLSREGREKVEQQAQTQAIERFKTRANEVAQGFGFSRYSLREVSVNTDGGGGYAPQPRMMAMAAKAAEDAPLPVEAGKATVSGSVQLQ